MQVNQKLLVLLRLASCALHCLSVPVCCVNLASIFRLQIHFKLFVSIIFNKVLPDADLVSI